MIPSEDNVTAYETRTTYGNKNELHLVLVEKDTFKPDEAVTWRNKLRYVKVYNLDGKYVMKLEISDVAYLGALCDSIKKDCLNMNDETKE